MVIRDGFVTNSLSTSFMIISKKQLTAEYLAEKLGIKKNAPNYYTILSLCEEMVDEGKRGFYHHSYEETDYELVKEFFGDETAQKYKKMSNKGYNVYCGRNTTKYNGIKCQNITVYNYKKSRHKIDKYHGLV